MGRIAGKIEGARRSIDKVDVQTPVAVVVEEAGALPVDVEQRLGDWISASDLVSEAGFVGDVAE